MSRLFNGSSDWAKVVAPQVGEGTIAAWVKIVTLPAAGGDDALWAFGDDTELASQPIATSDKTLFVSPNGDLQAYVYDGAVKSQASILGLAAGAWHHVGITFSVADGLRVWADAVASSATALSGATYTGYAAPRWAVAALVGPAGSPTGATISRGNIKLQQVGIWNRVLTQGEFNGLVAGQSPGTAAGSGLQIQILSDTNFVDTLGGTVTLTGTSFDSDNAVAAATADSGGIGLYSPRGTTQPVARGWA